MSLYKFYSVWIRTYIFLIVAHISVSSMTNQAVDFIYNYFAIRLKNNVRNHGGPSPIEASWEFPTLILQEPACKDNPKPLSLLKNKNHHITYIFSFTVYLNHSKPTTAIWGLETYFHTLGSQINFWCVYLSWNREPFHWSNYICYIF